MDTFGTISDGLMEGALRAAGAKGWRRNVRFVGVTPDFIWKDERVAFFVDGCFWRGCPRCYSEPQTKAAFWIRKINGNRRRDDLQRRWLVTCGWMVLRFWECEVRRSSGLLAENISRLVLRARSVA